MAGADGGLATVLLGVDDHRALWSYAGLPGRLPEGRYRIDARLERDAATRAALGWALGCYSFERYKSRRNDRAVPGLVWPEGCDRGAVRRTADATFSVTSLSI